MEQYAEVVLDLAGNAVPGASVQVLVGSVNGALATIYDAGGTPQQNPIPTGLRGDFAFQAANGKYVLRVLINGTPYAVVGPLTFYDPNDDTRFSSLDTSLRPDINAIGARTTTVEQSVSVAQTKLARTIDVMDSRFAGGVKADGVTGDRAAVQAAIDYAQTGGFDADIVFPAKKLRIEGPLVIGAARNIRMLGQAGPFTGTQLYVDFNGALFVSSAAQTWSMENIQVASDPVAYPLSQPIKLTSTNGSAQVYMNLRNCTFNNLGRGPSFSNGFNCRFEGLKIASIKERGLEVLGGSTLTMISGAIEHCGGDGAYFNGNSTTLINVHFEYNAKTVSGARELILAGDTINILGGIVAPVNTGTIPPILVTGTAVAIQGLKGYGLAAGVASWGEIVGTYAGVTEIGNLSWSGNTSNLVKIVSGVPGSSTSDILIGGVSLMAGAIVEQGTNVNGRWIRYANGKQECWSVSGQFYAASGTNYEKVWTFPKPFVDANVTVPPPNSAAADPAYRPNATARVKATTKSAATMVFSDSDIGYNAFATGFWK